MLTLITGANGFVGSNLAAFLLKEGHQVRCLVRPTSDRTILTQLTAPYLGGGKGEAFSSRDTNIDARLEMAFGDVMDKKSLREAVRDVDIILHVAGKVAGKTQEEFDQVNQLGTRCLFEAIQESGQVPKRILLLSSIAAGSPSKPNCPVDEDSPPGPVTFYGKSKLKGELEALPFKDKFSICILRPPIIYGPADKAMFDVFRLVKRRIHIYVGVENQKISIIEISDLCRAVILCATHENADGQTFYVANPDSITWKELGRIIGEAFEKKYVNIRIPPFLLPALARISEWSGAISGGTPIFNRQKVPEALAPSWECNGEKIRRLLGFETSIGLEEGIVRTLEWYRANKWL